MEVPLVSNGKSDAKSLVVGVLSKEWPLSAKKVFVRARSSMGCTLTYQGIHKALRQLNEREVLNKGVDGYSLNKEWITQLKDFSDDLEHAYLNGKNASLLDLPLHSTTTFEFDGPLVEPYVWLVREVEKVVLSRFTVPQVLFRQKRALPLPLLLGKEAHRLKTIYERGKHLVAVEGKTPLDSAFLDLWKRYGVKTLQGSKVPETDEAVLFDFLVEIHHSEKSERRMKRLFDGSRTRFPDVRRFYEALFFQPCETSFVVTRNPVLAEQARMQLLEEFRNQ